MQWCISRFLHRLVAWEIENWEYINVSVKIHPEVFVSTVSSKTDVKFAEFFHSILVSSERVRKLTWILNFDFKMNFNIFFFFRIIFLKTWTDTAYPTSLESMTMASNTSYWNSDIFIFISNVNHIRISKNRKINKDIFLIMTMILS